MAAPDGPEARPPLRRTPRRAAGALKRLFRMPGEAAARHEALVADHRATQAMVADLSARVEAARLRSHEEIAAIRAELLSELAAELRGLGLGTEQMDALLRFVAAEHSEALRRIASTSAAMAEHIAAEDATAAPDGPLVSVIVPVRDRSDALLHALASLRRQTYERWECVVVDDGSQDEVEKVLVGHIDDRVRVVRIEPSGACAARNTGLAAATGDLIAFLDSDNEWFPSRLAHVVAAMTAAPWAGWAVDGQLIDDTSGAMPHVRNLRLPLTVLDEANFIDLGSVVVRRELLDAAGPFDPELERFGDWDLIRRLAAIEPPMRLPTIGFRYHDDGEDRISVRTPAGPAFHRIRTRSTGDAAAGLRILFAEWHYPQLTETYVEAELQGLRRLGAHIEVWSEDDVAVPFTPVVPVHRGSLADAIETVRPDLVVSHWIHIGLNHRPTTRAAGLPHAVRGHGFDFDDGVVDLLLADPGVSVHLFPHQLGRWAGHPRASAHPAAFDPGRYPPRPDKDRRLVVRLVAGLWTKDVEVFWETARRCPDHRFVLAVAHAYQCEERTEEVLDAAARSGAPVDCRVDLDMTAAADLVGRAGIYLHTHGTNHGYGMSMSLAESMATGSYVVARDLPGMRPYVADAGDLYDGETIEARADHAAALINATLRWDEDRWQQAWRRSVDNAWTRFPSDLVALDMLAAWRQQLGVGTG